MNTWPWLFLGGLVFFLVVEAEKFLVRTFGLVGARGGEQEVGSGPITSAPSAPPRAVGPGLDKWQALLGALAVAALIGGEIFVFVRPEPDRQLSSGASPASLPPQVSPAQTAAVHAPVYVFAPVSGKIVALLCEKGVAVKAGQICAKLDPTPFKEAVARERDALATVLQRQQASAAAAAAATMDVERKQRAQGRGARPALEKARVVLVRAKAQAEGDNAAVEQARAALATAEASLAQVDIAAPVAGTIASVGSVGATIEPGKLPAAFSIAPDSPGERGDEAPSDDSANP